jgi:DDE superfamily endonuclease
VRRSAHPEEEVVFQQDDDPKHTSKTVINWLQAQRFELMKWPAQSSDLNPIENLWAIVKKRLENYQTAPGNMDELWGRVQAEWRRIPNEILQNLVQSMPKRVESVIKRKGLWTKY